MSSEVNISSENIPYASLQIIVSLLGIFGNVIVIWVIIILKEYQKSVTHWYVLQLSVADLLFLITIPFSAVETLLSSWPFPEWMCKMKEAILFLNYYASVFLLVVMSVDRYIAVCHAFSEKLQKFRKRMSAFLITLNIWVIASFLCIPVIMAAFKSGTQPECKCLYDFKVFLPDSNACASQNDCTSNLRRYCVNKTVPILTEYEEEFSSGNFSAEHIFDFTDSYITDSYNYPGEFVYGDTVPAGIVDTYCHYITEPIGFYVFLGFNFTVLFMIPLLIMVVCYGFIIVRLSSTQMTKVGESFRKRNTSTSHSQSVRKRVTVMCATLVCCFVICWLPYHAVHLAKIKGIDGTKSEICSKLSNLGSILAYLNSALNPCLYGFLGTNFRKRLSTARRSLRVSYRGRHSSSSVFLPARQSTKVRRERHSSNSTNAPRPELARLKKNSAGNNSSTQDGIPDLQFRNNKTNQK